MGVACVAVPVECAACSRDSELEAQGSPPYRTCACLCCAEEPEAELIPDLYDFLSGKWNLSRARLYRRYVWCVIFTVCVIHIQVGLKLL